MNANPERWRPVPGYEGLYEVSDVGRVRSLPRTTTSGRLLKLTDDGKGYPFVNLSKNNRARVRRVHQLVADAFIGPRPEGQEIRHLNGDPTDNAVGNLRYDTHAENNRDRVRHGTHSEIRKTHCPSGHPYDEANTYRDPKGWRACRECHRRRETQRYRAGKKS